MTEEKLHKSICDYIKLQFPKVLFSTDTSGIKLTIGQAVKVKKLRSSNSFPDISIYQPNCNYYGLFLEVKKETPYKKCGELKKVDHLQNQDKMHKELRRRGYSAIFVWSFEQAKDVVDKYMKLVK